MQRILLALCDRFVCVQDVGPMSESDVTGELGRGPKLFLLVNRTREGAEALAKSGANLSSKLSGSRFVVTVKPASPTRKPL